MLGASGCACVHVRLRPATEALPPATAGVLANAAAVATGSIAMSKNTFTGTSIATFTVPFVGSVETTRGGVGTRVGVALASPERGLSPIALSAATR